jgi:hypothetical protein
MIKQGNFTVVLDSCVLYKANIRDLLLRIAKNELYQPRWSKAICNEVVKNLIVRGAVTPENSQRLIEVMNRAFPEALIDGYMNLNVEKSLEINDKDKHVLAAAIVINAEIIVTDNIKDFPNSILEKYNIEAQSSDMFLQNLFELSSEIVINSFIELEQSLNNPPIPRSKLLNGLMKQAPVFTRQLKEHLD